LFAGTLLELEETLEIEETLELVELLKLELATEEVELDELVFTLDDVDELVFALELVPQALATTP
jgi:hypothetical protein